VRYQTEFFTEFYGEAYAEKTREFRSIQEILGQLQDQTILSQFLLETVGASWPSLLPSLEAYFQQERMALWKQWQPIQHSYLDLEGRDALRRTILTLRA
jgi:CHAD domain-containing protein